MKYDRTCSASGMFVANDVRSFNEIWRKSLYNFRRVTKSNNSIVNHVFHFTRAQQSGRTVIIYYILCKYVIIIIIYLLPSKFKTKSTVVKYIHETIKMLSAACVKMCI